MNEQPNAVTFKGNAMTLQGDPIEAGQKAPDFTLVANDLSQKSLSDFAGKTVILSVVPSLDTGTCDAQTRRFNEEAAKFGDNVVVLTVSLDLPFAQKRWCGAAGIEHVTTLSDYRDRQFGPSYGVLLKELGLLTRAVFIIDPEGVVRYKQIVPEVAEEPDYADVLNALQQLA
ncbi:MAG: thiol peroxidase [Phycisphaeraceae bacterium]